MKTNDMNTDQLVADLKRVVLDSEELLEATASVAGEKACQMRARVADTVQSAKKACRMLEEKAREKAEAADKAIRTHPYQAMGVAFGAGMIAGFLTTRRFSK
jgi:ElaB/YqjD/DUF883 family membrane-anchored ribosome-binding protein